MLTSLRSWLAELLRPSRELPAAAPPPAPVVNAPKEGGEATRNQKRLERRRHEAEGRADKAEQRVARAEKARKVAETRASALESELAAAKQRAASAEAQLKKAGDARPKKGDQARGKPDGSGEKLRALEDRLRTTQARAEQAERSLAEANARAEAAVARANSAAGEAEATAAKGSALRRGVPRTWLDVHFSPGDECLIAICRQIEQTERTADVCVFTITDDRISNCLLDAHRRGVKVRIITDNDKALDEGSDVHRLGRAGIEVREDQTPFHMHHKFAVFDGSRMITGSYNWTRGAARNNHENVVVSDDVRLIGPFVREFAALWDELGRG
jgi:phosphatidylserine/phosphatidylglycerophosphate/cardiolipin synthase-like enzyme